MNLKEAQKKGKIKDFIKEHKKDAAKGDKKLFDKAVASICKTEKQAQETSSQDSPEN